MLPSCFALLDDATAGSRLYLGLQQVLSGANAADLARCLDSMQAALQAGYHAVGVFDYELGQSMPGLAQPAPADGSRAPGQDAMAPLFRILLFDTCEHLDAAQVDAWLAAHADPAAAGLAQIRSNVDQARFARDLARIHAYIEAGDTYQVNYTFRLHFDAYGPLARLYARLRARQSVPYGALIGLPDGTALLSFSPELFVRHHNGVLTARPMKGTAAASNDPAQNQQIASALAHDPKNRAENLMIVDLLRNDLGRLALTGSVKVPALFEVSRFGAVLQMTSTIEAQLAANTSLFDVFAALFPCGSITGAPKRRTMEIIAELESVPRGIYTGAIGWFEAPSVPGAPGQPTAPGDFCLSVPIRTLHVSAPNAGGVRHGEMGVGAGIVYDSVAGDEYRECQLKAAFLTGLAPEFTLFETLRVAHQGCALLDAHLARLAASAAYFGIPCDSAQLRPWVEAQCAQHGARLGPGQVLRARLTLAADGKADMTFAPLDGITEPVALLLGLRATPDDELLLRHKTSQRAEYDAAWQQAGQAGAFDRLFHNQDGQLSEGGRCNLLLQLDGQWFTPPLARGVLPGVMRAQLMRDPNWQVQERELTLLHLRQAQRIAVCNALRGVMAAYIVWPDPALA